MVRNQGAYSGHNLHSQEIHMLKMAGPYDQCINEETDHIDVLLNIQLIFAPYIAFTGWFVASFMVCLHHLYMVCDVTNLLLRK
jgi:hypothetical protein